MKLSERIKYIDQTLDQMYPDPPVPLNHKDPYTLLLAVLLSAQCTDDRVNQITPQLFKLADNPQDMAKKSVSQINDIVRPCGLAPKKAQAINDLSKLLNLHHRSKVPSTFEQLEALPGVGHKTASVVMSQWYGFPAFPVDTHIHRLAKRWGLSKGKNVEMTERDLKKIWPRKLWNKLQNPKISRRVR